MIHFFSPPLAAPEQAEKSLLPLVGRDDAPMCKAKLGTDRVSALQENTEGLKKK